MPEGPECKKIAEELAKFVSNKTITKINILSGRYTKKSPSSFDAINENLPIQVAGVGVHGKFIYWILDKEFSIWNTLGMTGSWNTDPGRKHNRLEFVLNDGSRLYFSDPRNFGTIKFVRGKHQLIEKLKSLGPDMLSQEVENNLFLEKMRKKDKKNICKVLMDQSVVSGIGNYVKAEALWLSKINPHVEVQDITDENLVNLNQNIQKILRESYNSGGATIRTYKNFNGENGEYANRFLVYNRKVDADGNPVLREHTPDGRTTHWSPIRQKE